jgi:hypothetical protein
MASEKISDSHSPRLSNSSDTSYEDLKDNPVALQQLEPLVSHDVPMSTKEAEPTAAAKYQYLAVYFAFNLGLTLYNKAVLAGKVSAEHLQSPSPPNWTSSDHNSSPSHTS